jgi:hypothetical protein
MDISRWILGAAVLGGVALCAWLARPLRICGSS